MMHDKSSSTLCPQLLYDIQETAKTLSICEKSVWNQTYPRGPLRSVKIGKRVLYHIDDIRLFIEQMKKGARNDA